MDELDEQIKTYLERHKTTREVLAKDAAGARLPEVSAELMQKAKDRMPGGSPRGTACPHCGKAITGFKKPLQQQILSNAIWLGAAAAFFAASFMYPRYFVQWALMAAFCGFKWALDQRATKTQILIYKALQEEGKAEAKDLHRVKDHL